MGIWETSVYNYKTNFNFKKKDMSKILFLLIIIYSFTSCNSKQNDTKQICFLETEDKKYNYNVTYHCTLKENIGYLDKFVNDFFFVTDSSFVLSNKKAIYLYNNKGEQLKVLGGYGRGPSEYISASQLYVSDSYIYVWCESLLKLIVFDAINGEYIREYKKFTSAIQKFVVVDDLLVYFYISGNVDNNIIKTFNLESKSFLESFGDITESDRLLFVNANNGGLCIMGDSVLYSYPSKTLISSLKNNKKTNVCEIIDNEFNINIDGAERVDRDYIIQIINYINNNSCVTGVHSFNDNVYLMTEVGHVGMDGEKRKMDYSKRKIIVYKMDKNFNPVKKIKLDYPHNMQKWRFIKDYLFYISYDETATLFVLNKIKIG